MTYMPVSRFDSIFSQIELQQADIQGGYVLKLNVF